MNKFDKELNALAARAIERADQIRRGVTLKLFSAIVKDTPVLTGRLRSSWMFSKNEPDKSVPNLSYTVGKDGQERVTGGAMQRVNKDMQDIVAQSAGDGETPIYMTNSQPYAWHIENGGSKKSPEGMARRNILRFARIIKVQVQTGRNEPV